MNDIELISKEFDELSAILKKKRITIDNKFRVDTASGTEYVGVTIIKKTYYWLSVNLNNENIITYSFINHFAGVRDKERGIVTQDIEKIKDFLKEFKNGK